jgi:hypothetical protein
VGFRVSPQTRAASTRYAASAPTPGASAVPALMSSTPFSPWIRTSESILRYRRITGGDVLGHPVTTFRYFGTVFSSSTRWGLAKGSCLGRSTSSLNYSFALSDRELCPVFLPLPGVERTLRSAKMICSFTASFAFASSIVSATVDHGQHLLRVQYGRDKSHRFAKLPIFIEE